MLVLLLSLTLITICIDLLALILFKRESLAIDESVQWPRVSILVPMRNEAQNVKGLLDSLSSLEYPADKVEILIGEDRSTDQTPELLSTLTSGNPQVTVVSIVQDLPNLKAKANVIGQLIPHCTSEYYFITDADVRVPPTWIKSILQNNPQKAGVVGGTTVVKVRDLWSGLQNIDWILAQGLLSVAGKLFGTIAVSGTNMMVTKQVCDAIGGYGNIPFSLTEDIGVLTAARDAGFTGKNLTDPKSTGLIEAQPSWASLLAQRARWTYGVLKLPKFIVLLLLIRAFFLVLVILLAFWHPGVAVAAYLTNVILGVILVRTIATAVGQKIALVHFLFFEVYWFLVATGGLFTRLFFTNINWKGRDF